MTHGAGKVAREREAAARAKGFTPFNPDPSGFNLFAAVRRNRRVKAINAAEAAGTKPAAKAKTTKPAARVSTAKTRTPRPIPNDKKRRKLGSTERSLLG